MFRKGKYITIRVNHQGKMATKKVMCTSMEYIWVKRVIVELFNLWLSW